MSKGACFVGRPYCTFLAFRFPSETMWYRGRRTPALSLDKQEEGGKYLKMALAITFEKHQVTGG